MDKNRELNLTELKLSASHKNRPNSVAADGFMSPKSDIRQSMRLQKSGLSSLKEDLSVSKILIY